MRNASTLLWIVVVPLLMLTSALLQAFPAANSAEPVAQVETF
jgi:hypothetical protein